MMNQGALFALSNKQKLNTRSSTEAELVGVNDTMTMILWMKHFIKAQGYPVLENMIYQDNESSMKLEKYGRQSSSKKTHHFDVCYYFITDNVQKGAVQIRYCPTRDMTTDFFTKPLQGTFKKFRDQILNLSGTPHICSSACTLKCLTDNMGIPSGNGGQECVGAYSAAERQHVGGNRQSRIRDDTSTKVMESRQAETRRQLETRRQKVCCKKTTNSPLAHSLEPTLK